MPLIPIIIGVGDIKNRSTAVADAKEPATLMLEAIEEAIKDASPSSASELRAAIDSIDVVKTWTWPYPDLPGLLAGKLGVERELKWKRYSEHGGDKPGKLFDEAAKRIAKGECRVAVVTGGEALASRAYSCSQTEQQQMKQLHWVTDTLQCLLVQPPKYSHHPAGHPPPKPWTLSSHRQGAI
jgi:acetyl-CoA acetyltransferase